jgi:hypothetical protein
MKAEIFARYFCRMHKDGFINSNVIPCEYCLGHGSTDPCFHPISDEQLIERLKVENSQHEQNFPHLQLLPSYILRFLLKLQVSMIQCVTQCILSAEPLLWMLAYNMFS